MKQELILLVVDTNIYAIETNQKMELLECLEDKLFLETEVLLGKEARIRVRIICHKLTEYGQKKKS